MLTQRHLWSKSVWFRRLRDLETWSVNKKLVSIQKGKPVKLRQVVIGTKQR